MEFSRKIAREIAMKSFGHVIDCIRGFSDSGYNLEEKGEDFEQNFEEDMIENKIKPTYSRIKMCREEYDKQVEILNKYLQKKYY